ncbi:MAG: sensor domain-containing diguanylate cyclase [Nitriliruptoraceae bacterium]
MTPVRIAEVGSVALEELPRACFIVSRDGLVRAANARAGHFVGADEGALLGRDVLGLYARIPEGRARAQELRTRFLAGRPIEGEVIAFETASGQIVWGQLWVQPVIDADGRTVESRSLVFDVTAQRRAKVEQQRSERRFRAAFLDAPIGTALLDKDGRTLAVNPALVRLLGSDESVLLGQRLASLFADEAADELAAAFAVEGSDTASELRLVGGDGDARWVRITVASLGLDAHDEVRVIVHMEDVSAARRLREQLEHAAIRDPLTGLLNRRGFLERGRDILAAADRHQRCVALLFLDVDGLKAVNDRRGHAAGDRLLADAADALRQRFRREDQIARWGGDEFCVLLDDTGQVAVDAIVAAWDETAAGLPDELLRLSLGRSLRLPGPSSSIESSWSTKPTRRCTRVDSSGSTSCQDRPVGSASAVGRPRSSQAGTASGGAGRARW